MDEYKRLIRTLEWFTRTIPDDEECLNKQELKRVFTFCAIPIRLPNKRIIKDESNRTKKKMAKRKHDK